MILTIRRPARSLFSLAAISAGLTAACAQDSTNFETSVRAAMAPSIDKQRTSVEKQTVLANRASRPVRAPSFFVLPIASNNISVVQCEPLPEETSEPGADRADPEDQVDSDLLAIGQTIGTRPCEASPGETVGLDQAVAREEVEAQNPFGPEANAEAGTKLLRLLFDQYADSMPLGLGAYNRGRAGESDGVPQIPDALKYVADIVRKLTQEDERKAATPFPADASETGP